MCNYFRNVRTMNEMRVACDPEITQFVRAKRNIKSLPNAWDDIPNARKKISTKRQIRRSQSNFRDSIRFITD